MTTPDNPIRLRPRRHRRRRRRRPRGAARAAGPAQRSRRPDACHPPRMVRRPALDRGRAVRVRIGSAPFAAGTRRRVRRGVLPRDRRGGKRRRASNQLRRAPTCAFRHADPCAGSPAELAVCRCDRVRGRRLAGQAVREMVGRLRSGEARSAAFVAPSTWTGWPLPLYELALMTARELAASNVEGVQLRLISSEDRPLALFGDQGTRASLAYWLRRGSSSSVRPRRGSTPAM